jgi:hypothetical protein
LNSKNREFTNHYICKYVRARVGDLSFERVEKKRTLLEKRFYALMITLIKEIADRIFELATTSRTAKPFEKIHHYSKHIFEAKDAVILILPEILRSRS